MKKLTFFLLFLFIGIISQAQVLKFESEAVSYKTFDIENNRFDNWEPWEPTRVLIIIDFERNKIDVYSQYEQHYNIISGIDTIILEEKTSFLFDALDEDIKRCSIELSKLNTGVTHFYVRWSNLQIVYQMNRIP